MAVGVCWYGWTLAANKRDSLGKDLKASQAQVAVLQLDLKLKEEAALQAAKDAGKLADQSKELNDARSAPGDDADTRRLRSLCVKLRQQSAARFNATPACRRFDGQAGTGNP